MSHDVQDFQSDVLDASRNKPVVVDFWADWCGPCKTLGPVLDKLAEEAEGRWTLVKVDTDQNPDLAMNFNVRGIPSVKMFHNGEVIAEFSGAQPEPRVRQWLQDNLPESSYGTGGADWQETVNEYLANGQRSDALDALRQWMEQEGQASTSMKVDMALLVLPDEIEKARKLFGELDEQDRASYMMEESAITTIAGLKEILEGDRNFDYEAKGAADYYQGIRALFEHRFEDALTHFINALSVNKELDNDGPRQAVLAIFSILSERHPLTNKYQRRFSMALY